MIKSYFTSALRHLLKNKGYTFLNAIGLSVGLACFTLIGLWVKDELSYDKFHANADHIYRIGGLFTDESGQFDQAVTCIPLAPALISDFPEVEDALRIDINDAVVQLNDKKFVEDDILGVDPSFFNLFSFKMLKGDKATALKEPYNIVLSESMAKKYFGDKDPIGESLRIFKYDPNGQGTEFKITGVIEDCPLNSHFHYNFLFSFKTIETVDPGSFGYDGWFNNGYYTYVLIKPRTKTDQLQAKLPTFLEKYIGSDMKKYKIYWSYFLQPLADIHLNSHLRYEIKPTSSVSYVVIFGSIGLIALLLACINYINLSTAYSSDRFKEVGVRKVMGAYKNQLAIQYLIESWMLAMISLVVAFAWMELARPLFESLTGKQVTELYTFKAIGTLLAITSLVGLLSGIYPSVILASFKTVNVLKGQFKSGTAGVWVRKNLVVLQYSITIILITGILVIQLQLNFIKSKDLGFDKDNLLVLNVNGSSEVQAGYDVFLNELLSNPNITGMARSNAFIAGGLGNRTATFIDATGKKIGGTIYTNGIDQEYIDAYGMKLIAGRNFKKGSKADSVGLIVNEATTKVYGYTNAEDAIGTEIYLGDTKCELIGVVKDFNYTTLHSRIEPTCMYLWRGGFSRIAVRLNGNVSDGVELVTSAWKKHFPNSVIDFSFAEERLQSTYQSEQRFSKIFFIFSTISLAIACLGLFALVSFSVESRTKEIGIRKVLGASVTSILGMLSKEFLALIVIATFIALPVGYYFMSQWLSGFAYQVDLNPGVFMLAGILVLVIAWLTVSARSIKAATANPVESLRNE
ncbi:MAG: ABC transporter permease [Bacteroidota bacterium]